jgi:hypothetical protein
LKFVVLKAVVDAEAVLWQYRKDLPNPLGAPNRRK